MTKEEEKKAVGQGMAIIAAATIMGGYNQPAMAMEILGAGGITLNENRKMGLSEFDLDQLE